jgi:hypothetical protein
VRGQQIAGRRWNTLNCCLASVDKVRVQIRITEWHEANGLIPVAKIAYTAHRIIVTRQHEVSYTVQKERISIGAWRGGDPKRIGQREAC